MSAIMVLHEGILFCEVALYDVSGCQRPTRDRFEHVMHVSRPLHSSPGSHRAASPELWNVSGLAEDNMQYEKVHSPVEIISFST